MSNCMQGPRLTLTQCKLSNLAVESVTLLRAASDARLPITLKLIREVQQDVSKAVDKAFAMGVENV
jgi:hypothetical protein